ncbi:MAG TPA: hypothetical protein VKY74_17845 [Chloroflexia bacterium]|nr:hypothetical protein [Chloroflexia bacterium]
MPIKVSPALLLGSSIVLSSVLLLLPAVSIGDSSGRIFDASGWALLAFLSPLVVLLADAGHLVGGMLLAALAGLGVLGVRLQRRGAPNAIGLALLGGLVLILGTVWAFTLWATATQARLGPPPFEIRYFHLLSGFWAVGAGLGSTVVLLLLGAVLAQAEPPRQLTLSRDMLLGSTALLLVGSLFLPIALVVNRSGEPSFVFYNGWELLLNARSFLLVTGTGLLVGGMLLAALVGLGVVSVQLQRQEVPDAIAWALLGGLVLILGTVWAFTLWGTNIGSSLGGVHPELWYFQLQGGFWVVGAGLGWTVVLLLWAVRARAEPPRPDLAPQE